MNKLNLKIRKLLLHDWFYYILAFIAILYAMIYINIPKYSVYSGNEHDINGNLSNYSIKNDKLSLELKSDEKLKCTYYFKSDEEKAKMIPSLKLGSQIHLTVELSTPQKNTIPNTFNYKKYLYNHGIFFTCKASTIAIDNSNIGIFYKIKNTIIDRIDTFDTTSGYLYTFILGDKSSMNEDVMETYRKNGVTHLFAISGMHIGLFAGILLFILKKLRVSENKRYIITITFIWFYAFLTGFPSSVLRAGLLFTLLTLNKIFYTEVKTLNVLLFTGSLLLFLKPFIVTDIGFIYSYLTTFGLIYASDTIKNHKIIGTSIIAFSSSLPVTINNFYEFNLFSILLNVLFVPFVSIIVYPICLLTFAFKFLEPIAHIILNILEWLSFTVSNINIFKIICPRMNIVFIVIYYSIFLIWINKRFKLTIILLCLTIFISSHMRFNDANYNVDFLDVGQGDSVLIRNLGNRDVILIDTGGVVSYGKENSTKKSNIADNIITYLKSLGIDKLTALVASHGDNDHMGEAIKIVNNFNVEKVIFNCGPYNDLEKQLIKVLNKKKIKYYSCIKELNMSNNKLYFLQTKEYDNENDNSNVAYTELNGYKFMFMGDAGIEKEKDILEKYNISDVDVLKVGHHGSKTSSGKEFIEEINPKYSIISVGKNNRNI